MSENNVRLTACNEKFMLFTVNGKPYSFGVNDRSVSSRGTWQPEHLMEALKIARENHILTQDFINVVSDYANALQR